MSLEDMDEEKLMQVREVLHLLGKLLEEDERNRPYLIEIARKFEDTRDPEGFIEQRAKACYYLIEVMLPTLGILEANSKDEFLDWAVHKMIGIIGVFLYIGYEYAATNMPLPQRESLHGTAVRMFMSQYGAKFRDCQKAGFADSKQEVQLIHTMEEQIERMGNSFIQLGIEYFPMVKKKRWGIF